MAKPIMIPIPIGTAGQTCTCGEIMYKAPHPSTGRIHPVTVTPGPPYSAETAEFCAHPTTEKAGQGVSHFADCIDAEQHRRRNR